MASLKIEENQKSQAIVKEETIVKNEMGEEESDESIHSRNSDSKRVKLEIIKEDTKVFDTLKIEPSTTVRGINSASLTAATECKEDQKELTTTILEAILKNKMCNNKFSKRFQNEDCSKAHVKQEEGTEMSGNFKVETSTAEAEIIISDSDDSESNQSPEEPVYVKLETKLKNEYYRDETEECVFDGGCNEDIMLECTKEEPRISGSSTSELASYSADSNANDGDVRAQACHNTVKNGGWSVNHLNRRVRTNFKCDHCYKMFGRKMHLTGYKATEAGEPSFKYSSSTSDATVNGDNTWAKLINGDIVQVCHGKHNDAETSINRKSFRKNTFKCDHCYKKYGQKVHLPECTTTESNFKCGICHQVFTLRSFLKAHLATHAEECKFKCTVCCKKFANKNSLSVHMVTHSGDYKYKCEICNTWYIHEDSLRNHMTTHVGDRFFKCEVCNKLFKLKGNLKNHMAVHAAAHNVECEVCRKTFRNKKTLKLHMVTHTEEYHFLCKICNKWFIDEDIFRDHMVVHGTTEVLL